MMKFITVLTAAVVAVVPSLTPVAIGSAAAAPADLTTAESGNPFVDGRYADPDIAEYDGTYWVYPTSSRSYDEQTYLDAFSSTDLVHWTKHPNVLRAADFSWASSAVWAPAPVKRNGKYYLYFAANDIQNDQQQGGIGVAVADRPEGPYRDAIGEPLIGEYHNGAQPIDQDVWIDDDGQAYMYYGGHSHANVVKLNEDMTSFGRFDDGTTFKEITPEGYVEGSQMFKRDGRYYLMWSEGGWTGPDYSVAYAMSDSPTGPFNRLDKVLAQDSAVARGAGHNSVMQIPGTDSWYIFYHRRPLSETGGNVRELAYDRMSFNSDGTIQRVTMKVQDNFDDGNAFGWRPFGGSWGNEDGKYVAQGVSDSKSLLDDSHTNFTYDADVTRTAGSGDAGLMFRVTRPGSGRDDYEGYYAGITANGSVVLGKSNYSWTGLGSAPVDTNAGPQHHLRIEATGSEIKVYVDDMNNPKIRVDDGTWTRGSSGVRTKDASAQFDNVVIRPR